VQTSKDAVKINFSSAELSVYDVHYKVKTRILNVKTDFEFLKTNIPTYCIT